MREQQALLNKVPDKGTPLPNVEQPNEPTKNKGPILGSKEGRDKKLSASEQAVLGAALVHGTDAAIAATLDLPIATIKSRWSRILRRIAATQVGAQLVADRASEHRGPQSRHVLLDYLRRNPWELTPYGP